MAQRKLIGLAAAVLVVACAGATAWWWAAAGDAARVGPPGLASLFAGPAGANDGGGCRFTLGDRAAFRVDSVAEVRGTTQTAPSDRYQAVLSWQVVSQAPAGEWLVRAALTSVNVQQQLSQPEQRLSQPLDAAFMLRIGSDCRFARKGFAHDWQATTRRFVAAMLGSFEFAVLPVAAGSGWEAEQADGMGRYAARYTGQRLTSGAFELVKEKTRYRDEQRGQGMGFQVQLVSASATGTLDAEGRWLQKASGQERVRLKAQALVLADLEQRFTLTRDDAAFVPPDSRVEAATLDWQDPFLMPIPAKVFTDPAIARLTLDAAIKRFETLYRKTPKGDAYASAMFLAEWLKTHPEGARSLLDQVRAGQMAEALRPAAFLALEQSGTPQARAVLAEALADKSLAELDRARAATALSDVPEITRESAHALVAAARSADSTLVAGTSVRALGHLGERAKTLNPELQSELRSVLQDELATAKTGSRAIDVIDAIGNSGDAHFATTLNQRLVDASPAMREHAARAMRKMEAPQAAPALVQRFPLETEAGVRTALADTLLALGVQDAGSLARGAGQLAAEPSAAARASLIRWLGAGLNEPVARAALAAQFRREKDPQLLQLIGRYLPADELK